MEIKLHEMTEEELEKLQELIYQESKKRKQEKVEKYQAKLSALVKEMYDNNIDLIFDYNYTNFHINSFHVDSSSTIIAECSEY